ncbi:MAG: CinA family protein, partial [Gammaproteobacteria bacterium]
MTKTTASASITPVRPQRLAQQVGKALQAHDWTLVTAESCTGGMVAEWVTRIAGSSGWFERGFVTYSNAAKSEQLDVLPATLDQYGAVSEEITAEMVAGALAHSDADIAVSVSGIAGPDGGAKTKPVGTVCFGWGRRDGVLVTATVYL